MARLPYAAKQFIKQAEALRSSTKYEPKDLDGLNVYRTLRFDKRTSKWLAPALDQFADMDERIEMYHVSDAGYLYLTFVATPDADNREPFLLEDAVEVAAASERYAE